MTDPLSYPPIFRFAFAGCEMRLLLVEGGSFRMGSDKHADPDAFSDEGPVREVHAPTFYLGQYPVTQALWRAVMGSSPAPSFFSGDYRPVEGVSWDDTRLFLEKLEGKTNIRFRLPTEAEWEFAARGGVYNTGCNYSGSRRLKEVGWFGKNSHGETKPVGRKFPNELGLYDMSGNVWEWCEDQWHNTYDGAPVDGSAWVDQEQGSDRVHRGGSWGNTPRYCRAALRGHWPPDDRTHSLGFRLALSLQSAGRPFEAGL